MKKSFPLLFMLLFFTSVVFAQDTSTTRLTEKGTVVKKQVLKPKGSFYQNKISFRSYDITLENMLKAKALFLKLQNPEATPVEKENVNLQLTELIATINESSNATVGKIMLNKLAFQELPELGNFKK